MRCIIYGLGNGREFVERAIRKEHCIIGYMDSFAHITEFNGRDFIELTNLHEYKFDYIIISICNPINSKKIREKLELHGVRSSRIVEFVWEYRFGIPYQKVDRVMKNPALNSIEYDGLIFGISHAARGINPNFLDGKVCNLALGSQDLYYNYKIFEYCKEKYIEKIKNIRYIILDFFDYTYLNFDTSLSSEALSYYLRGGFNLDEHNYAKNINFNCSILKELGENKYILDNNDDYLHDELFYDFYKFNGYYNFHDFPDVDYSYDYFELEKNRQYVIFKDKVTISKSDCIQIKNLRYAEKRVFKDTITENKKIIYAWIDSIQHLNPNIYIFIVMLPRYKAVEDIHKYTMVGWKKTFYSFINDLRRKYKFYFLDYKNEDSISSNPNFYSDYAHLNYNSSLAFTSILRKQISEIMSIY